MPRSGDDERDAEHARRKQDPLPFRVHRSGEQECGGGEAPARPVAEPTANQQGRDDHENVDEDVRLRCY